MVFFRRNDYKSGLRECINDLKKENSTTEVHFNIYRRNGDVISQMFRCKDVRNWNWPINIADNKELILVLQFESKKKNNRKNYNSFKSSIFFQDFIRISHYDIPTFAYFIPYGRTVDEIYKLLIEILNDVYGFIRKVKYEVVNFE